MMLYTIIRKTNGKIEKETSKSVYQLKLNSMKYSFLQPIQFVIMKFSNFLSFTMFQHYYLEKLELENHVL